MPDVIVIGGGPAGCAAAWVLSRHGARVLLLSSSLDTVCLAASPEVTPEPDSCELFAAVDLRGSVPARELHRRVKWLLEQQDSLHLLQADASALLVDAAGTVTGVRTWEGPEFSAPLVGLCAGSFLSARLRAGALSEAAGKPGQMSYPDLAEDLAAHGVPLVRTSYAFSHAGQPATVDSLVVAAGAPDAAGWLSQPRGLAAAGYCLDPGVSFGAAARAGQQLGEMLLAQSRAVSSTGRT